MKNRTSALRMLLFLAWWVALAEGGIGSCDVEYVNNGISEEDILIHYANNTKLLPEEWQLVFMQSTSLRSAIFTLDTFFPPVSDLSQELIMELTKKYIL